MMPNPQPPQKRYLTGLYHFSQTVYGLQSPCLRLTQTVTSLSSRLGKGCARSALSLLLSQQLAVNHFVTHNIQYLISNIN